MLPSGNSGSANSASSKQASGAAGAGESCPAQPWQAPNSSCQRGRSSVTHTRSAARR